MLLGSALPQGTQHTIGRTAALRAGLPVTVAGMTLDRQCSSGLMTIATAAKQVMVGPYEAARVEVMAPGHLPSNQQRSSWASPCTRIRLERSLTDRPSGYELRQPRKPSVSWNPR